MIRSGLKRRRRQLERKRDASLKPLASFVAQQIRQAFRIPLSPDEEEQAYAALFQLLEENGPGRVPKWLEEIGDPDVAERLRKAWSKTRARTRVRKRHAGKVAAE